MTTMVINLSHSAVQLIDQYYNFVRYGFEDYRNINLKTHDVAVYLVKEIEKNGLFEIINLLLMKG